MYLLRKVPLPRLSRRVSILSPEEKKKESIPFFFKISGVTASVGGIIGLYGGIKDVISFDPSSLRGYYTPHFFPEPNVIFSAIWKGPNDIIFTTPPGIGHIFSNTIFGIFYGGLVPTGVLLLPTVLTIFACLLAAESASAYPWFYWMLWDQKKK